jgi:YbbR domain-containing protein
MDQTIKEILNNLSSIILALLLAVTIWIAATLQADPFIVQQFASVPVEMVNQPANTVLFEGEGGRITVDARAPRSVLESVGVSDFEVRLDLSQAPIGSVASMPISVTVANEAVRIEKYRPEVQAVRLEAVESFSLPVNISVEGQVATGYQNARPAIQPSEVVIQGAVPDLIRVVSATGTINIAGAREDIVQQVGIVPMDADGRVVSEVEWHPERVQVSIDVRRRVGYKPDVQVVPDLRGEPAPGYRRGSVVVEPSTVTLQGPNAVLDEMPSFVKTQPISITDFTENLTVRRPLTVPANVIVVEVNLVTVTVEILPVLSGRTVTRSVEVQGLRQDWQAILSPAVVEVLIEGPEAQLEALTPADLRILVDLSGYGLGVYRVEPIQIAPQEITVVSIIPETIEVAIELPPTPPPTSTMEIGNLFY